MVLNEEQKAMLEGEYGAGTAYAHENPVCDRGVL